MEFIPAEKIVSLSNPGVVSRQLLNPDNSSGEKVTISEVHVAPGACQPRHLHESSEQIWYALQRLRRPAPGRRGRALLASRRRGALCRGGNPRPAQ